MAAVPVFCNVLWDSREEAIGAARGDVSLHFCECCGMAHNAAFDPELVRYSPAYENSLHFSPAFREFARDLAKRLIDRYDLRGKRIVDIGCGKGEFLKLLCDGTGNRGIGFDPSYDGQADAGGGGVTFRREYFSQAHAATPADFICCRHMLEHLDEPRQLLSALERSPATLYFEVPDGAYMLREAASWDVIYEHVGYFTPPALRRLFEGSGFKTLEIGSSFGGQYLYIEAAAGGGGRRRAPTTEGLASLVTRFAERHTANVEAWSRRLAELDAEGRLVALWGAGSKGVTFLNVVPGGQNVELVIDLNERKQGRFVPGTGQQIQAPEYLREQRPDVVVAVNPLYVDEIRHTLEELDVGAEILDLRLGPGPGRTARVGS